MLRRERRNDLQKSMLKIKRIPDIAGWKEMKFFDALLNLFSTTFHSKIWLLTRIPLKKKVVLSTVIPIYKMKHVPEYFELIRRMTARKGRRSGAWKYAECYFSFVAIGFNCPILSHRYTCFDAKFHKSANNFIKVSIKFIRPETSSILFVSGRHEINICYGLYLSSHINLTLIFVAT